jgi:hypothetical protein
MTTNGRGTTVHMRISECMALAAGAQPGQDHERYLAESWGLEDANAGFVRSPIRHGYTSDHEVTAYHRGFDDATTLLRISKGVQP